MSPATWGVIHDPSGPAITDRTAPTVTCGPVSTFRLGQSPALVTATVSDAGSGPVSSTVSAAVDASTAGTRSVALEGSDRAGNTATVTCSYKVESQTLVSRLVALLRWLIGILHR